MAKKTDTEDPKPNSPEDLGYTGKGRGRGKRALNPAEREELERLAELLAEDEGDVERGTAAVDRAKKPVKEAKARAKKHLQQMRTVVAGQWSPGLFEKQDQEKDKADADGGDGEGKAE